MLGCDGMGCFFLYTNNTCCSWSVILIWEGIAMHCALHVVLVPMNNSSYWLYSTCTEYYIIVASKVSWYVLYSRYVRFQGENSFGRHEYKMCCQSMCCFKHVQFCDAFGIFAFLIGCGYFGTFWSLILHCNCRFAQKRLVIGIIYEIWCSCDCLMLLCKHTAGLLDIFYKAIQVYVVQLVIFKWDVVTFQAFHEQIWVEFVCTSPFTIQGSSKRSQIIILTDFQKPFETGMVISTGIFSYYTTL